MRRLTFLKLSLCIPFALLILLYTAGMAEVKPHEFAAANVEVLNVRKTPGGELLRKLSKGENVYVLDLVERKGKTWAHVCLINAQYRVAGYVDTRYLDGLHDSWKNIIRVACGEKHVLALDSEGTIYCMGDRWRDDRSVSGLTGQADIAAGRFFSAALSETGILTISNDDFTKQIPNNWPLLARVYGNSADTLSAMDAEGKLYTTRMAAYDTILSFPEDWRNANQLITTAASAIMVDGSRVLHTLIFNPEPYSASAMAEIIEADGLTGVQDAVVCGVEQIVLLMQDGTIRVIGNSNGLSRAENWTNISAIAGSTSYVIGISGDGSVHMAGQISRIDVNDRHISTDQPINLEDTGELSGYTDIVAAACSDRLILLLHADGTADMLSGMYFTP